MHRCSSCAHGSSHVQAACGLVLAVAHCHETWQLPHRDDIERLLNAAADALQAGGEADLAGRQVMLSASMPSDD